jgi:hypothetical protein
MKKPLLLLSILLTTMFSAQADDNYGHFPALDSKNIWHRLPIWLRRISARLVSRVEGHNKLTVKPAYASIPAT